MQTLFFYGTLRHLPLLEIVLGRSLQSDTVFEATLANHRARAVEGEEFPIICEETGTCIGIVCTELSENEVARLNFYEGGYDYTLKPITVTAVTGEKVDAQVYFAQPGRFTVSADWDFVDWQSKHSARTCLAAQEAMTYFGQKSDAELEFMFPMIRARASAQLTAKRDNPAFSPSDFSRSDYGLVKETNLATGYFRFVEYDVWFRKYDGTPSGTVKREVFLATDAAIVLPYDPARDRVLLIEQFRMGPFGRGDEKPWHLEPIAGRVDAGETAETTAVREAQEEAGLTVKRLHKASQGYASPGCSTEYFSIFIAEADLPDEIVGINGLDSEQEDIRSHLFSFDELMMMVENFQAANTPLVLAALWLARHQDRLRSMA